MSKPQRILLADNKPSYSETCAEYLQLRGYQVDHVASPEECERAVETDTPHLLILDLRMRDDTDEKDVSGLTLAKKLHPRLPKIILTAFPTWEMTREALTITEQGLPAATAFVSKLEGLPVLHQYVQRAFAEHVRLNWDLTIDWGAQSPRDLTQQIEPELAEADLPQRIDELEDLLRRLFLHATQLKMDQVLWQRSGRAALQVNVSASGKLTEPVLVICGRHDLVWVEVELYQRQAPKTPQTGVLKQQSESAETIHYAATAFALSGGGLVLDLANQSAWVAGKERKLTPLPFKLLCFLYEYACKHPKQVCTRRNIIEDFFGQEYDEKDVRGQEGLVDQNIHRIRAALKELAPERDYLVTVRGQGFRLVLDE